MKVFRIDDEAGLVIAKSKNKKFADKIKIMNNSEIEELITYLKKNHFRDDLSIHKSD